MSFSWVPVVRGGPASLAAPVGAVQAGTVDVRSVLSFCVLLQTCSPRIDY